MCSTICTIAPTAGVTPAGIGSVVQHAIARSETITGSGQQPPPAQGVSAGENFQPTSENMAAITGDFVMMGSEVDPVAQALTANGIEVSAMHQHHIDEQQRLFCMHIWANDDPVKLATGLRGTRPDAAGASAQLRTFVTCVWCRTFSGMPTHAPSLLCPPRRQGLDNPVSAVRIRPCESCSFVNGAALPRQMCEEPRNGVDQPRRPLTAPRAQRPLDRISRGMSAPRSSDVGDRLPTHPRAPATCGVHNRARRPN